MTNEKVYVILCKLSWGVTWKTATRIAFPSAFAAKETQTKYSNTEYRWHQKSYLKSKTKSNRSVPFLSPSGTERKDGREERGRTLTTAYKITERESNITVKVKNWCNTYTIYVIHKYKAIYAESKLTIYNFKKISKSLNRLSYKEHIGGCLGIRRRRRTW